MPYDSHLSGGARSLRMSVDKIGFLLDRLGQDCSPLQFLRELTQNGIEAINRTNAHGKVVWDVDWFAYDNQILEGRRPPMKLCVIDTGDGMNGEEMLKFINQLSSSGSQQSMDANYGVGAKIAAATKNPAGVIYQSWKDGIGYMVYLEKNENGDYGLRQWEAADGSFEYYVLLDDDVKPPEIGEHGTKVTLIGKSFYEDTIAPPQDVSAPSRWVSKYLNTRYFCFPENVEVRAREGWDNPRDDHDRNILRKITGQGPYFDKHAKESGTKRFKNFSVYWWILRDEPAITNNSGYIESAGHVAALYQNELYDRATSRSGSALLQQFGVLFGMRQVVIYVEPNPKNAELTTNTARTSLLISGEKLPLSDWAVEFREGLPKALVEFVNSKAPTGDDKDHVNSIKDRLKNVMDLYKVSRYRPVPQGRYIADELSSINVAATRDGGKRAGGAGAKKLGSQAGGDSPGLRDEDIGSILHAFQAKKGEASEKVEIDPFPKVSWVSREEGNRDDDQMEDRAAQYLPGQNHLIINGDFRVFKDMTVRLAKEYSKTEGVDLSGAVQDVVRAWFEQALVETVIGIQQLKGSREWGPDKIEGALSEESLTATVMQRYHVHIACKRELGAKLGKRIKSTGAA